MKNSWVFQNHHSIKGNQWKVLILNSQRARNLEDKALELLRKEWLSWTVQTIQHKAFQILQIQIQLAVNSKNPFIKDKKVRKPGVVLFLAKIFWWVMQPRLLDQAILKKLTNLIWLLISWSKKTRRIKNSQNFHSETLLLNQKDWHLEAERSKPVTKSIRLKVSAN